MIGSLSATVADLTPGDRVPGLDGTVTFVQQAQHPLWPHLRLVIWKMADGSWSHDALDSRQEVGMVLPATADERKRALREALLHSSHAQSPSCLGDIDTGGRLVL